MILLVLLVLCILIIAVWTAAFFYLNDFSLPDADLSRYRRILLVFPHPDDEVLTAGGLIAKNHARAHTFLLLLTKGERGTPDAHLSEELKTIRAAEAKKSSSILGFKTLIHKDMGDGMLDKKTAEITSVIDRTIGKLKPDLIITYDKSGLYGHDDHIAVSKAATGLVKRKYKSIKLWYASFPKRVLDRAKLPVHMATDPEFLKNRTAPTAKVFIGRHVLDKLSALYAHTSQLPSYQKGVPLRIPLRLYYSLTLFEYFFEAN
jgi:LmbE family N-acetylglucosaminyl deacetylase